MTPNPRPLLDAAVGLERLTDELDGRIRTADHLRLAATVTALRQADRDTLEATTRLDAILSALADARPALVRAATVYANAGPVTDTAARRQAHRADLEVLDNLADLIAELHPEVLA